MDVWPGRQAGSCWLERRELLDPRDAEHAARQPAMNAVNIPISELPARTHELPPRHVPVRVAGPHELVTRACAWLAAHGRLVESRPEAELRYGPAEPHVLGRLWEPNAFLSQIADAHPPGRAIDLGCGCGREAVYLAAQGWCVTGVDVLPDALTRAASLAQQCAGPSAVLNWQVADATAADFRIAEPVDLIACLRFFHRPLLARLHQWLRPGGVLVVEAFTPTHRARHGKPACGTRTLTAVEARTLLGDLEIEVLNEGERAGDAHTVQVCARRR